MANEPAEPAETIVAGEDLKLANLRDVGLGVVRVKRKIVGAEEARGPVLLGQEEEKDLPAIALTFDVRSGDKQPIRLAIPPANALQLISGVADMLHELHHMGDVDDEEVDDG